MQILSSKDAETRIATLRQRLREGFTELRALRAKHQAAKDAYLLALSKVATEGHSKPPRAAIEKGEQEIQDLEEQILGLAMAVREMEEKRIELRLTEMREKKEGLSQALAKLMEQMKGKREELDAMREREAELAVAIRSLQDQIDAPPKSFPPAEIRSLDDLELLTLNPAFKSVHELPRLIREIEEALASEPRGVVFRISESVANGRSQVRIESNTPSRA